MRLKTRSCSPCPVTRDKDTSSVPITHVTSEAPLPSHPEIVLPQIYLQYCVDITLETISWKKMIKGRSFCFKFKHPRAASQLNITSHLSCSTGDTAVLENVGCKVFYISTPDQVGVPPAFLLYPQPLTDLPLCLGQEDDLCLATKTVDHHRSRNCRNGRPGDIYSGVSF